MRKIKLILLVVLLLVAVFVGAWFVQDNNSSTDVVLLGFHLGIMPVGVWVLVFFLSGVVVGVALSYPAIFGLKRQSRRSLKMLRKLEGDLGKAQQNGVGDKPSS